MFHVFISVVFICQNALLCILRMDACHSVHVISVFKKCIAWRHKLQGNTY